MFGFSWWVLFVWGVLFSGGEVGGCCLCFSPPRIVMAEGKFSWQLLLLPYLDDVQSRQCQDAVSVVATSSKLSRKS